ncbi:MAG TPA: hypothetical protein VFB66_24750 [Tepidisphaeraceae bacterium]|nr:hypothetical protein [Tepidisphaeraceae bacterium]
MAPATTDILAALRQQVECYRRLQKLAGLQHEHVQQNSTEQLLAVLVKRQEVLDELAGLERVVAPAKRDWPARAASMQPPMRAEAEGLIAESKRLLQEIMRADGNDVLALQQRKLNLGREINQAAAARQVNRNYAASAYGQKARTGVDLQR